MSPLQRAVLRFLGVYAVFAGVELLERVAYRAGVVDAAAEADKLLAGLEDEDLHAHRWQPWHPVAGDATRERRHCAVWGCTAVRDRIVDESAAAADAIAEVIVKAVVDDLEAVDVSDVVAAHAHCCAGGSSC